MVTSAEAHRQSICKPTWRYMILYLVSVKGRTDLITSVCIYVMYPLSQNEVLHLVFLGHITPKHYTGLIAVSW